MYMCVFICVMIISVAQTVQHWTLGWLVNIEWRACQREVAISWIEQFPGIYGLRFGHRNLLSKSRNATHMTEMFNKPTNNFGFL